MTKTSSSTTDRATLYAEAVVRGEIVAGPHVRNACRRHLDDLKRDDIAFDPAAATKALRFFEEKLRLSEGQFEVGLSSLSLRRISSSGRCSAGKNWTAGAGFVGLTSSRARGTGNRPLLAGLGSMA
jgi:hypothetical protein